MKKLLVGIALVGFAVASTSAMAHYNHGHHHSHHGGHGGGHVDNGDAFVLGALMGSLFTSTLLDERNNQYDLTLVNDVADDAAVFTVTGETTELLADFIAGYQGTQAELSEAQIVDAYLAQVEKLLTQ